MNREASNISVPNRCIWCLCDASDATFDSESHVLPECTGNEQQVLPSGIVCDECNNYFGTKIEPKLINDPILHIIAYCLKLRSPRTKKLLCNRIFDKQNPAVEGEHQVIHLDTNISSRTMSLSIDYSSKGRINKSYTDRDVALLSRAVHKIAFESLAWGIFVKSIRYEDIDVFDSMFNYIRKWSRYGEPQNNIRPMLRRQIPDLMHEAKFGYDLHKRGTNSLIVNLNLFGDLYGVSLTSSPETVEKDLRNWALKPRDYPVWFMGKEFISLT